MRTPRLGIAVSLVLATSTGLRVPAQEVGRDATRSMVTVIDADGKSKRIVLESNRQVNAPSWSPDGSFLTLSAGRDLWRIPIHGLSEPGEIRTGSTGWIGADHGISPDGKALAFTSGPIWLLPVGGGRPSTGDSPFPELLPRLVA